MARRPKDRISSPSTCVRLPDDLAPTLREAVDTLLRQVPLAGRPGSSGRRRPTPTATVVNRCVFCHKTGKLGGHHDERSGEVVWVHRKCHRRHHRAHRRTSRSDRWWQARVVPLQQVA